MSKAEPIVVYDYSGHMLRYQGYQRAGTLLNDLRKQGLLPDDDRPQVVIRLPGQGRGLLYHAWNDLVVPGRIATQEGIIGLPEVPWYWVDGKRVTNLVYNMASVDSV